MTVAASRARIHDDGRQHLARIHDDGGGGRSLQ
jgi:hypothetical protein